MVREDLTGRRFGMLTVVAPAPNMGRGARWHVVCDCGREKNVLAKNLKSGQTKSCGCRIGRHPHTKQKEWAKKQPSPRNYKGLCYNVYCPYRHNYRSTVWSCIRCATCPDRLRERLSMKSEA